MLRKGVYLYKCMDSYKRFNETSLPDKKNNYNNLNIENITDADYKHVWRDFALKNLGDYHDLYVQSDKLILLMYFRTFEPNARKHINLSDPAPFFISTRISIDKQFWKRLKIVLELLTDIDALQMVEKEIWGEVCYGIYRYATVNNNLKKCLNA